MYNRFACVLITFIVLSCCCIGQSEQKDDIHDIPKDDGTIEGTSCNFMVGDTYLQACDGTSWNDVFVKGVNLGLGIPGYFPGDSAIQKEDYAEWIDLIGEMNANTIRTYIIHPPVFYEALLEYNKGAESPIYLIQGIWLDEEMHVEEKDPFSEEVTSAFYAAMEDTIDVIHGNADIAQVAGKSYGAYSSDVSDYTMAYIIGIEWYEQVVKLTDESHYGMQDYDGEFFKSLDASPFEIWLSMMLDHTAAYEYGKYSVQRPLSFVSWPTTDPLTHTAEPSDKEDICSIDPNDIWAKDTFLAGYFASYHVYPYYPEFMNYTDTYVGYVDSEGEKNNYAGYLHDLIEHHRMPVLVAEFGVPSSRGMAHTNVYGMDQGHHSENEQGEIDARLFRSIIDEGYAGGLVFTWQDEWFKRTWNTMDFVNLDRTAFWSDAQTNEQQFGMLAFDPGPWDQVIVDGDGSEWKDNPRALCPYPDTGDAISSFMVTCDERYVYFLLESDSISSNWENCELLILLDTMEGQGNTSIPGIGDAATGAGSEFFIRIAGDGDSRMGIDCYYDSYYFLYGYLLGIIDYQQEAELTDSGVYNPLRHMLSGELTIPTTGAYIPVRFYETGVLMQGTADTDSPDYDSLTDYAVDEGNGCIEVRIPWAMMGIKDPSTREALPNHWKDGLYTSKHIDGISICMVFSDGAARTCLPELVDGTMPADDSYLYQWPTWGAPTYHERLKESYYIMQAEYGRYQ